MTKTTASFDKRPFGMVPSVKCAAQNKEPILPDPLDLGADISRVYTISYLVDGEQQTDDRNLKEFVPQTMRSSMVRVSATIDWNLKESVRAVMRVMITRLLAKYDYPPDRSERAVELVLVLEQAKLFAIDEARE